MCIYCVAYDSCTRVFKNPIIEEMIKFRCKKKENTNKKRPVPTKKKDQALYTGKGRNVHSIHNGHEQKNQNQQKGEDRKKTSVRREGNVNLGECVRKKNQDEEWEEDSI